MIRLYLHDELATTQLGELLFTWLSAAASESENGISVFMRGPLGAGKSALTRAVLRAAGVNGNIPSPTYSLVEHYPVSTSLQFYHVDAYRLAGSDELDYLGAEDWSGPGVVLMVEWPDRVINALPSPQLEITFDYIEQKSRPEKGTGSDSNAKRVQPGVNLTVCADPNSSGSTATGASIEEGSARTDGSVSARVVTLTGSAVAAESPLGAILKKGALMSDDSSDLDASQSSRSVF